MISLTGHLAVGAAIAALALWAPRESPQVHVVNLVPTVAAVGTPRGQVSTPPPPAPAPPIEPRPTPQPAPPTTRPALDPPPSLPPRPREALSLPAPPPRPASLPPRPLALPRPGEKELPPMASEPRPAPARPVPDQPVAARPAPPPAPLGQATGSTVGSGALTLDVSDFPHAWYLRQVLRKVEEQWQRRGLTQEPVEKPLVLVEIQRNGSVQMPRIERSSGNAYYDQAALRAIMDASPFPELPRDWTRPVLRVMFRFDLKHQG